MGGNDELITEVGPFDVLFGRGSGPNSHDGNVRFRALVNQRKEEYLRTNHRQTKVKIASEIVEQVLVHGGRFLKRVNPEEAKKQGYKEGEEVYCAVDHDTMMEKAKQALRQNMDKHGSKEERRNSSMSETSGMGRMRSPRVVTPGDPLDPYEPDPVREVVPLSMAQQQHLQQQQQFSSANIEAWTDYATAQVNSSAFPSQQSKVDSLSELTGSIEVSNMIQNIVNVRKDEYFSASDPQTKAMIARQIVDAALAESGRTRQNNMSSHPFEAMLQQQQQQNLHMQPPQQQSMNSMGPPPHQVPSNGQNHYQSSSANVGGGGFNLYTMAAGSDRSSSGSNQFSSNNGAMPPPHTPSSYDDQQVSQGYSENTGSKSKKSKNRQKNVPPSDDQSMDEYQMMLEQYISNTLTPGDSQSELMASGDLVGMTDHDSIGTFNQSDAGELESMAESSMMSFSSKHKKGGIDSFLSANHPSNTKSSKSKLMSSASSRNSRKNAGLKAHFSLQDQKKSRKSATLGNSSVMSSSIMSGKSHRSTKSSKSTRSNKSGRSGARDDMSITSGFSNFSGVSGDDNLSLMSEMTDLSAALNSLDLAGDYSQVLK